MSVQVEPQVVITPMINFFLLLALGMLPVSII